MYYLIIFMIKNNNHKIILLSLIYSLVSGIWYAFLLAFVILPQIENNNNNNVIIDVMRKMEHYNYFLFFIQFLFVY